MSKTFDLSGDGNVWITTYLVHPETRYYKLVVNMDGWRISKAFNTKELFDTLCVSNQVYGREVDDGMRPNFDNSAERNRTFLCPSCEGFPKHPNRVVVGRVNGFPIFANCTNPIHNGEMGR